MFICPEPSKTPSVFTPLSNEFGTHKTVKASYGLGLSHFQYERLTNHCSPRCATRVFKAGSQLIAHRGNHFGSIKIGVLFPFQKTFAGLHFRPCSVGVVERGTGHADGHADGHVDGHADGHADQSRSGCTQHSAHSVRTGSWTGPPRGKKAPRVGMSSTVFGVRA